MSNRLLFSLGSEDYRTDHQALNINAGDRVVCLTGSGDRPLHLLLKECKEVIAIDSNPEQTHLLELKKNALKFLPYDDYAPFMGVGSSSKRRALWNDLRTTLTEEAQQFWDQRYTMVHKGIIYQGHLEKRIALLARLIRLFRKKKIQALFACTTLEEQKKLLQKEWNSSFWNTSFDLLMHPRMMRFLQTDSRMHAQVSSTIVPGTYVRERWNACLDSCLAQKNTLISFVLKGKIEKEALPPYLTRKGAAIIRSRLDRLHLRTEDVLSFLKSQNPQSIDVFSLSDVASYLSKEAFHELLKEVHRTAKPGARFCLRQFLSDHPLPDHLPSNFKRDPLLEKRLEKEDRTFVYRFCAGVID